MPTGPVIVAEQLPDDYPTKKIALDFRSVFQKVNNAPTTDAFSAYSFDGYLVFADAAARRADKGEPGTPAVPRGAARRDLQHARKWWARTASTTSSRATSTASTSARA